MALGAHGCPPARSYSLSCELEPPSESASNTLKARKSTAIVKRWSEWVLSVGAGGPPGGAGGGQLELRSQLLPDQAWGQGRHPTSLGLRVLL